MTRPAGDVGTWGGGDKALSRGRGLDMGLEYYSNSSTRVGLRPDLGPEPAPAAGPAQNYAAGSPVMALRRCVGVYARTYERII
jgi:hypothetical protein